MFKIVQNRTFTHDVTVLIPIDGGHAEEKLKTTFNYLDADKLLTLDAGTSEGADAFFAAIVSSFHDCVDQNGNAVPYSEELRKTLLGMHNVRRALFLHYDAAVRKTKEGN